MHPNIPRLVSVKRLAELYPEQFPQARTRDLIYHSVPRISARGEAIPPNGFASCIVRRGGKVELDLDAIPLWVEQCRAHSRTATGGGVKAVIRPHPLAEAIPAMSDAEYNELNDDIKANGLLPPIVVFEGLILDGRHRYKACGELGIKDKIKNFAGDANAALAYVISANLKRRNLTKSRRAAAAAKLATMRQGERTDLEPSANLPKVSQADAAAAMQVSERSIGQVNAIEREAPELVDEIKAGTMTVNKAAKIAKERKRHAEGTEAEVRPEARQCEGAGRRLPRTHREGHPHARR